ncbi:6450_t:CDS:2 [Funneliformis mosseae]|uniref:6450_t:CDS:1 n=1 Tax=Funneliformis mosseae TaxID=27381 RepID=A0A9N8VFY1_FUNMO|nr:6450_t:CDS:2 [Funneliformis mosseae]
MAKGVLKVTVGKSLSAKGLRNADEVGKSDPYVVLSIDGAESQRTTTKVGTLDPVWNETFTFQVDRQSRLYFKIWDSDPEKADKGKINDDWLAEGKIDLTEVFTKHHVEGTHELKHNLGFTKDGVITLRLDFNPVK